MDKINEFSVKELSLEGFKCFGERKTFRFGSMNSITGHNGLGKSSIAEAISYAITGVPFYGGENGLDRLYEIGGKSMSVELTIEADGGTHRLVRCRDRDNTAISYDGTPVRQTDLTAMFGERDVFLSIFNPLYFIKILGDRGKNLLERYLPAVPHETVLEGLSGSSRALLEGQKFLSPEALLDNLRIEVKELETSVVYTEGQRDLLESQARENAGELKRKTDELNAVSQRIGELETKRVHSVDVSELREKLSALYSRYDELSKDGTAADTASIDAEILEASQALEKRRADMYVSQYAQHISEMQAGVTHLRELYSKESSVLTGLKPGIRCPMCKQAVTEQNIESVKKSFSDSIDGILSKGRELAAQLSELSGMDEKAKAVFDSFKHDDVNSFEARIGDLKAKRAAVIKEAENDALLRKTAMDSLHGEIQSLEFDIENGNLEHGEVQELSELRQKKAELASAVVFLTETRNSTDIADISSLKKTIKDRKELETAARLYIAERSRLMFADFDMLQRVSISLYDIIKKTGEVKDAFRLSYEGKPYKFISLSEEIRAGLELSELVKKLTGRNYPVFIDNGESVPVIDNVRPTGQIFVAQVVKGAPLSVDSPGLARAA